MTTIKDLTELIADILDPARWKRQPTVMTLAVHTGQFRAWRGIVGLDDETDTVAGLRPTTFTRLLRDARNAEADRDRYADVLHRIASGSIPAGGAAQEAYDALDGATPGPDTLAYVAADRDRLRDVATRFAGENAQLCVEVDRLANGGRELGKAVQHLSDTIMAAWIDARRGDHAASREWLTQYVEAVPEVEPPLDGETGQQWLERVTASREPA